MYFGFNSHKYRVLHLTIPRYTSTKFPTLHFYLHYYYSLTDVINGAMYSRLVS